MRALAEFLRRRGGRDVKRPMQKPIRPQGAAHHLRVHALSRVMRGAVHGLLIGGTGAAVGLAPATAATEELRAQFELLEAHIALHAEVAGGMLTVEVDMGQSGFFSRGTKGKATISLHGILPYEQIAALEGCTHDTTLDGALRNGGFEGTRTQTSTCPAGTQMPIDVDGLLKQLSSGVPAGSLQIGVVATATTDAAQPAACGEQPTLPKGCTPRCPSALTRPDTTAKPEAFPEDPDTPGEFSLNFKVIATNLSEHPSGYKVVHGSLPIPGLTPNVTRISQSGEVEVYFTRGEEGKAGFARWRLRGTAMPGEDEVRGVFERVDVPVHGEDLTGPTEFKVGLQVLAAPDANGCTAKLVPDATTPPALRGRIHCAVIEAIPGLQEQHVVAVWEERGDGTSAGTRPGRAYRGKLTTEQLTAAKSGVTTVTLSAY